MPLTALNQTTVNKPVSDGLNTSRSSARRTVIYRDLKGQTWDALVVSAGGTSGLKLKIVSRLTKATQTVDNVALGTTLKQTNVYFNRLQ